MRTLIITFICCLQIAGSYAQTLKESNWVASVEQDVKNIYSTQLNIPLIETKVGNLFALEPSTGEILWKMSFPQSIQSITPLDGTPYSFINGDLLVNISTGKSLNLGSLLKGRMKTYYVIPESFDLFVHSENPEYFTLIDLFDLQVKWTMRSDITGKSTQEGKSKLAGAFMQVNSPNLEVGLECPPISNKNGGVIIAGFGKLTSIDSKGQVTWSVLQPKKKKGGMVQTVDNKTTLLLDDVKDQFYIMKSKLMTAIRISDGSQLWPEFYEVKGDVLLSTAAGVLPIAMYHEQGSASGGSSMFAKTKLNPVDYETGNPVWPNDLEVKGAVDQFKILPDGNVALITYNQTNSKLQILDLKAGKLVFPEEVKLKGRVETFVAGKDKIMFLTTKGIDLIEIATGKDLLSRMPNFDSDADVFTVFNGQYIYNIDSKNKDVIKTDLLANESKKILTNFKFDVGEPLSKYDVLPDGKLFLASNHHMKVFSPTGDLLIDKPFDYQGKGKDKFNKMVSNVDQGFHSVKRSIAFSISSVVVFAGNASGDQATKDLGYQIKAPEMARYQITKNQKAADYYLSLKRLSKDVATAGSFFVRRNKEAKQSYVSYVNKSTGEVIFDIPLEEDATGPEFAIGEDIGMIYYAPQFVNQNKADFQAIFNPSKLRNAEANNRMGFVAGYEFK